MPAASTLFASAALGGCRTPARYRVSVTDVRARSARRRARTVPLRYDDGFRGTIALLISVPFIVPLLVTLFGGGARRVGAEVGLIGIALSVFSVVYAAWTHRLFSATPPDRLEQIAAEQYRRGPSLLERGMGFAGTVNWAAWAAIAAILVAMMTAIVWYQERSVWLPVIAVVTAASSWVLTVYAFALRYLRLNSAGETIELDIREAPTFSDFLSVATLIATVAALSGGIPRTRPAMKAMRAQSVIAFAFNSVVIATTVSLVIGLLGPA